MFQLKLCASETETAKERNFMAFINCPECNQSLSEKAKVCVHCGYPIVEEKPATVEAPKTPSYKLTKTSNASHPLATITRISAVLTAIGGVITAFVLSFEEVYSRYGGYRTKFHFWTFLICLLSAAFSAYVMWMTADLIEKIQNTHEMLSTLDITDRPEGAAGKSNAKSSFRFGGMVGSKSSPSVNQGKACPKCGRINPIGKSICKDCGASMY